MLVSGNAALHANSDRHLTASWNESMTARKYLSKMLATNKSHNFMYDYHANNDSSIVERRSCSNTAKGVLLASNSIP